MAKTHRFLSFGALIALAACVTPPAKPLPEMRGTQPAGIGISIGIHSGLRNQEPNAAYFVRLHDRDEVFSSQRVISSNYVKGHNAYLLNAEPGLYAAIAASYSQLLPRGAIGRVAYFPEGLIRKTIVEVKPDTISYMGTYEVDMAFMAGFRDADKAQEHYRAQLRTELISTFQSAEKRSVRDAASEKEFFQRAREDFAESEWSAMASGNWAQTPTLDRIERAVTQIERAESSGDAGAFRDRLPPELSDADGALAEYLKTNPNDVRGLILSARLGRIQLTWKPLTQDPGKASPDFAAPFAPLLANLDRALTLHPGNAEAHYWKGRLLGVRVPVVRQGVMHYVPINLRGAIVSLKEAVKLAPDSPSYREALALVLTEDEKPDEALEVMRPAAQGRHILYQLLADLKRFPLPDGAVLSAQDSQALAQMQAASGSGTNYLGLRVRAYLLPMSATQLERFFAGHWPGFQLFPQEETKLPSGGVMRSFAQYMTDRGSSYRYAASSSEIPGAPKRGVLLSVTEFQNMPAEQRSGMPMGTSVPASFGATYTMLVVFNLR